MLKTVLSGPWPTPTAGAKGLCAWAVRSGQEGRVNILIFCVQRGWRRLSRRGCTDTGVIQADTISRNLVRSPSISHNLTYPHVHLLHLLSEIDAVSCSWMRGVISRNLADGEI